MWGRKLLFPFSLLYGSAVYTRNHLYDAGFLKSKKYDHPIICVGNLSVGGTGKSPMVEYLLRILMKEYNLATLSRGYKRESKGFYLLKGTEPAKMVGDEPLQFKNKFPEVVVAVDEDRQHGIENLFHFKKPDVIILDDAFQHRKVEAGFNILLTSYGNLYINDMILPAGNLREPKVGAGRADVVVVTKCPANFSKTKMVEIEKKLKLAEHQKLFFTRIKYSNNVQNLQKSASLNNFGGENFCLVTGIANPAPLVKHLKDLDLKFDHLKYPDHHNFSKLEIEKINSCGKILTTEKDFMRLKDKISSEKLFYLPIEVEFLQNEDVFKDEVFNFIKKKMG